MDDNLLGLFIDLLKVRPVKEPGKQTRWNLIVRQVCSYFNLKNNNVNIFYTKKLEKAKQTLQKLFSSGLFSVFPPTCPAESKKQNITFPISFVGKV